MHRRRFDPASLLAGLLFLTVAGVYLTVGITMRAVVPIELLGSGVLVGLGAVGLVRVLTRSHRGGP